MSMEKLLELYQEKVLPCVVHLETKERTRLFKSLEKGEENELVISWKGLLKEKGINSDLVMKDYLVYLEGLNGLDEEDLKKLKNKNTYFLRKNTETLVKQFEELKPVVKEEVIVEEEVIEEKATSRLFFLKGKKIKKKKEVKKNKNKNRKKKNRKKIK